MSRLLLWKLCLIIGAGTVVLFYVINVLTSRTEEGMSFISDAHQQEMRAWGEKAEHLYTTGQINELNDWLNELQQQENTWAAVFSSGLHPIAGGELNPRFYEAFTVGRSMEWKIHLYFKNNPIIEIPFGSRHQHFSILLPERMRPGIYWGYVNVILQIVLPIILLTLLATVLYHHIMSPLSILQKATRSFSKGKYDVRVSNLMGSRNDELAELANTFDQMAIRTGEMIISQRQLLSDLSHELRTPLTRLDIAVQQMHDENPGLATERIERESQRMRQLVEDTLTLAWLENEQPELRDETLDIVDLIDVLVQDAQFEYSDRRIHCTMPNELSIHQSNHRALGQALENIIRNAMRYTPSNGQVDIKLKRNGEHVSLCVSDEGPGVPEQHLSNIFAPFFRVDGARKNLHGTKPTGFGLGLALAKRQIEAVGGTLTASNRQPQGLSMCIKLPSNNTTQAKQNNM